MKDVTNRRTQRSFPAPGLSVILLLGIAAGTAADAEAQATASAQSSPRTWSVANLPHVDLWYHGLAVVDFEGFGPLDFYSDDYAARARQEKEQLGIFPTQLDELAPRLRSAFERDSTFEVFHFMPLYFAAASRGGMLDALGEVAQGTDAAQISDLTVRFGAAAAAAVLSRPSQRQVLAEFVEALEEEWRAFYSSFWAKLAAENMERYRQLQETWDGRFATALAGYLQGVNLDQGIIVVTPPLGPEGRIFEGDPGNRADNLIAVRADVVQGAPNATLHSVVREACYPVVRRVMNNLASARQDRVSAERASSRAAVRCGAILLEQRAPELVEEYRRSFPTLAPAEAGPEEVAREFVRAFPLDEEVEVALRAALREM
jgi:hypothetical protein